MLLPRIAQSLQSCGKQAITSRVVSPARANMATTARAKKRAMPVESVGSGGEEGAGVLLMTLKGVW